MDTQHEFLKVPEVAKELRIARSRAYELVANGTIPAVKIGRSDHVDVHVTVGQGPEQSGGDTARFRGPRVKP